MFVFMAMQVHFLCNHKAVSVKRFFQYLNKAVTIASSDRGTNLVWVDSSMIATYAWNCSPIDGTDVVRNVPARGCEFRFPFDLNMDSVTPAVRPLSVPWNHTTKSFSTFLFQNLNVNFQNTVAAATTVLIVATWAAVRSLLRKC
jgi:hypothetical protein